VIAACASIPDTGLDVGEMFEEELNSLLARHRVTSPTLRLRCQMWQRTRSVFSQATLLFTFIEPGLIPNAVSITLFVVAVRIGVFLSGLAVVILCMWAVTWLILASEWWLVILFYLGIFILVALAVTWLGVFVVRVIAKAIRVTEETRQLRR